MITKFINSGSFVFIIICFLLPFLSIKCGDTKLITFSGTDLAFGTEYNLDNQNPFKGLSEDNNTIGSENTENKKLKSDKHIESSPLMIAILVIALLGVILSFLLKKGISIAAIVCAVLILIGLVIATMSFEHSLGNESGGKESMQMMKIGIGYEIGFWLILIASLGIVVYNIIDVANSTRKRDISPVI